MTTASPQKGPVLDQLIECYFETIGPLHVTRWEESGNVQEIARFHLPQVDQQVAQPVGVSAQIIRGEMVFLTSLGDPDLYPSKYVQMRKATRVPEPRILRHPIDGEIMGYMTEFNPIWDIEVTNGCRVNFQFERIADEFDAFPALYFKDAMTTAATNATIADFGMATLKLIMPADAEGKGFEAQVAGLLNLINNNPFVDDLNAYMANYQRIANQVLAYEQLGNPENYEVYRAIRTVSAEMTRAADEASRNAARIIETPPLPNKMTALEAGLWVYKDPTRAQDILDLNPARYFFYPRGLILRVADI